ncbi:MAG TPA: filamentous hemagglutinin N-terminal domain-containing protein, partial [Burkholderiales bacterium]
MRSSRRSRAQKARRDEGAFARLRPARRTLAYAVGAAFAASALPAFANPSGGSVAAGGASFVTSGNSLIVTNTPGAIINWQQFSIQKDEITRFIQQSAASGVLNRVIGQNPSLILGQLTSNGRVFLINPSGIAFGQGAMIDVAGFAASTLNISDADFLSGRMRFVGSGAEGKLTNAGTIRTAEGGSVWLIAPNVENQASGVITSPKGEVVIAAGKTVELVNSRTPDLRVEFVAPENQAINAGEVVAASGVVGIYGTLIKNSGRVSASGAEVGDGGKVVFKATKDITLESTSRVEANGAQGGEITVQAEGGTALVSGAVEAKGESAKGGTIRLLGSQVGVTASTTVDASGASGGGSVLVGGDFQGSNAAVQNAQNTYVGTGATIRADAGAQGDGGKVVVWADGATAFGGTISARGGLLGGDGGNAEVSGKEFLLYRGLADLRAPRGRAGDLLLDPNDITIIHDPTDQTVAVTGFLTTLGPPFEFLGNAASSTLNDATINAQLASANVRVKTGSGTITFDTSSGAGGNIDLHAPVSTPTNLTFDANNDLSFIGGGSTMVDLQGGQLTLRGKTGAISETGGSTLDLAGGTLLLMIAGTGIGTSGTPFVTTGMTDLAATTTASGGIFIQNSGSNILLRSSLTGDDLTGGGTQNASGLSTQGGDISLQNTGNISSEVGADIVAKGADNPVGNGSAGGAVTATSTGGSVTLRNVDARGGNATGLTGDGGAGGVLTVTAGGGTVTLNGSVQTDGGSPGATGTYGSGGAVTVSGSAGVAINDPITTKGGNVSISSSAGSVTSNASGDITTTATANSGINSGNVTISGAAGVALAGKIDTEGANNNAGDGAAGGTVQVTSTGGAISLVLVDARGGNSTGGSGDGGQGGSITSSASGGASDITLNGSLKTDSGTPDTGGVQLAGGTVNVAGEAGVLVKGLINTEGGAVTISSSAGAVTSNASGDITTKAALGSAIDSGTLIISAATDVALAGNIDTDGAASAGNASAGGAVTITAGSGSISVAAVDTRGGNSSGGNGGAGGAVTLTAGGTVTISGLMRTAAGSGGTPGADGTVQITGADVDVPGSINSGSADVTFLTGTPAATIGVGDTGQTFNLTDNDLDDVNTTGTIRIGSIATNTAGISIGATDALTQGSTKFAFATAGGIAVGTNNFTTTGTVSLTSSAGAITTGAGAIAASTLSATAHSGIALNTNVGTLGLTNSASGDVVVTDADSVSVSGTNTGGGAFNITAGGSGNTLTVNPANINANTGSVTLRGDTLVLTGTVNADAGVTLRPNTTSATIGVEDAVQAFNVTNAMLGQIATASVVTVGVVDHTGDISAAGDNAIATNKSLALTTGGSIQLTDSGSAHTNGISAKSLVLTADADANDSGSIAQSTNNGGRLSTTTGDLTLSASQGIGVIAANPIRIGAVGGNLSATNNSAGTPSGDLFLDILAASLNVGGTSGINQYTGGALRLDSSGDMVITGDLFAGTGSISLNPTGTLTRTTGTLTADTIKLGVDANATTSIGATGAGAIRVASSSGSASPAVGVKATTGGVFLNQASGDLHAASYALDVNGIGQTIELATTDGHITIDHDYTTQWNTNTQDDNVSLIARGTNKNIVGG